MELTIDNIDNFIKFLKCFMHMSRKKQIGVIKKLEKELKSKCSK